MSSTTYVAPPYVWAVAALVLVYLGLLGFLMNYLRRFHEDVWIDLGRPAFVPQPGYVLSALGFIFGRRHQQLSDSRLDTIIWAVRILFTSALAMVALGCVFGLMSLS